MRITRLASVIALGFAFILLAGCARSEGPASSQSDTAASSESLEEILGFSQMSEADAVIEIQREIQAETAKCMRLAGFDYAERVVSTELGLDMALMASSVLTTDTAATTGYGVFDNLSRVGAFERGEIEAPSDPNAATLATMSAQEVDAWNLALYGVPGDPDAGTPLDLASDVGCTSAAAAIALDSLQVLDAIGDDLAEMENRFNGDSRVVESARRWSACMADAGLHYESSQAASDAVWSRLAEALGLDGSGATTDIELESLRLWEIQVATTDASCAEAEADTLKSVRGEYEAEFLSSHRAVLTS